MYDNALIPGCRPRRAGGTVGEGINDDDALTQAGVSLTIGGTRRVRTCPVAVASESGCGSRVKTASAVDIGSAGMTIDHGAADIGAFRLVHRRISLPDEGVRIVPGVS